MAVVSLMTAASLEPLATAGSDSFIAYAVLLALVVLLVAPATAYLPIAAMAGVIVLVAAGGGTARIYAGAAGLDLDDRRLQRTGYVSDQQLRALYEG